MQIQISRFILTAMLAAGVAALAAGCASTSEKKEKNARVSPAEMSGPARATLDKVTTGGKVDQIEKETEKGKLVYDVEATVGGKHVEFLIADADGAVLGTEVPIEYGELPAAVRAAAENFFGGATGLKAMKSVEYGETTYEIEGAKNGKKAEANFDPSGSRAK